jgi:hypothetical protein
MRGFPLQHGFSPRGGALRRLRRGQSPMAATTGDPRFDFADNPSSPSPILVRVENRVSRLS